MFPACVAYFPPFPLGSGLIFSPNILSKISVFRRKFFLELVSSRCWFPDSRVGPRSRAAILGPSFRRSGFCEKTRRAALFMRVNRKPFVGNRKHFWLWYSILGGGGWWSDDGYSIFGVGLSQGYTAAGISINCGIFNLTCNSQQGRGLARFLSVGQISYLKLGDDDTRGIGAGRGWLNFRTNVRQTCHVFELAKGYA